MSDAFRNYLVSDVIDGEHPKSIWLLVSGSWIYVPTPYINFGCIVSDWPRCAINPHDVQAFSLDAPIR